MAGAPPPDRHRAEQKMTAMRCIAISMMLVGLATGFAKDQSLEELKARLESAPPDERPAICLHIAQDELRAVDKAYNEGNVDQARPALKEIVAYSEKARDTAVASGKHLKNVEIAVRKIAARLNDIKRTLNF